MIKLEDFINALSENTRIMIFSERDVDQILFGGFKEDMSSLFLGLYGKDEVVLIRTIFKDLWIKIKEV